VLNNHYCWLFSQLEISMLIVKIISVLIKF